MKYLVGETIKTSVVENGVQYTVPLTNFESELYLVVILHDRADHFEMHVEKWNEAVGDSASFADLLSALKRADEIIAERIPTDYPRVHQLWR